LTTLPTPCLPPLAEQSRIVAKVDELMAVCDELEQSLATEQTERSRLLEALLRDALEGGRPATQGRSAPDRGLEPPSSFPALTSAAV
jgi:hypothetical protein